MSNRDRSAMKETHRRLRNLKLTIKLVPPTQG